MNFNECSVVKGLCNWVFETMKTLYLKPVPLPANLFNLPYEYIMILFHPRRFYHMSKSVPTPTQTCLISVQNVQLAFKHFYKVSTTFLLIRSVGPISLVCGYGIGWAGWVEDRFLRVHPQSLLTPCDIYVCCLLLPLCTSSHPLICPAIATSTRSYPVPCFTPSNLCIAVFCSSQCARCCDISGKLFTRINLAFVRLPAKGNSSGVVDSDTCTATLYHSVCNWAVSKSIMSTWRCLFRISWAL